MFTFEIDKPRVEWKKLFQGLPQWDVSGWTARLTEIPNAARGLGKKALASVAILAMAFCFVLVIGRAGMYLLRRGPAETKVEPHAVREQAKRPEPLPAPAAIHPAAAKRPQATALPAGGAAHSGAWEHSMEWVRRTALKRATTHLAENFDHGMGAWGASSKTWAPGWSHSPDGFVRPGQLALFRPTLGYGDYEMEFFSEIESKGVSWAVRGKDTQNYYAMKFSLVQTGLRPVISLVHYPVVDGKPGHKVVVPLSAMVHNHTPYHVAVQVSGSHYSVSLEGEEVDSWSDDTLPGGGVGFFSESGERARIYWVTVSHNDDWLGHLCGQIAAAGAVRETASLEPAGRPSAPRGDTP